MAAATNPMDPAALAAIDVLLLDIEGTVCPISFVKDVLFPYALEALPKVLDEQWDSPTLAPYRDAFPEEYRDNRPALEAHVRDLVQRDVKASYLKSLQGHLWRHGYETGVLKAPLFEDVAPFIRTAHSAGKKVIIYSSGSVPAQKLFFGHTSADPSDMTPLVSDWYDTVNAGLKMEAASYKKILAAHPEVEDPLRWLFLSDNMSEVEAAKEAGMQSLPVVRPGNAALPADHPLTPIAVTSFHAN
ncbi:enolase-phosphatase E1 [Lecanicillium sp. MT-2017a]|nr:enolase-phosphatase E1 [Lecanicillium sp. MT-2017a]